MKALVLEANEKLVYKDVPTPGINDNEVLIRVYFCGICGSDLPRVYNSTARAYPFVLGHEFSGVVEKLGKNVHGLKPGDRVTAVPLIPCMECVDCKNGDYSLCSNYSFIGSRRWGAMAEFVCVPAENVIIIPDTLSFKQAATIEPATVGLHALEHVKFKSGAKVAVIGCGIIGLDTMQWARIRGADRVVAIGRGEYGLTAARKTGAQPISTNDYSNEEIIKMFPGGFDYVFECSGAEQTMQIALELVRNKGSVCYIGTPKKDISFTVKQWEIINRKECWITGSWMSYSYPFPGIEWEETIKYMNNGEFIDIPERVFSVFPIESGTDAFALIHEGKSKGRILIDNRML